MDNKRDEDITRERINQKDLATKTYAALSIALICVVLGIPMWWKTTTTYRANLPYHQIEQLAKLKVNMVIPVDVWLCLNIKQGIDSLVHRKLEQKLNLGYVRLDDLSIDYRISFQECTNEMRQMLLNSKTLKEFDTELRWKDHDDSLQSSMGKSGVYIIPASYCNASNMYVSQGRRAYVKFQEDVDNSVVMVTQLIRDVFSNERIMLKSSSTKKGKEQHKQADVDSMRALRSSPGYELSFNLLNPDPAHIHCIWDIASGVESYLQPFLDKLSEFADFRVESQILYYTKLSVKPRKESRNNSYILPFELLAHVINPIEARLGSHISTNPDLNFVIYLPTKSQSPLYIMDASGNRSPFNAFLSPRWGGVMVYNVDENKSNSLVDMQHVMEVFVSQLRVLLGIPSQKTDLFPSIKGKDNSAISDWEVDVLFRCKTLENIASATSTLTSLSQLLEKIPNMVIKDNVAKEVYSAVETIQLSHHYLSEGNAYRAFYTSKKAIETSEKAFFDSSLLELLYFPEDQKFAIYIPLFLPIMLPIISSVYKAFKWLRTKDKGSLKDKED